MKNVILTVILTVGIAAMSFASGIIEMDSQDPGLVVINMADTHSAYDAYPKLLAGITDVVEGYKDSEVVILFNGDLLEYGNAAALKSGGIADGYFLQRLSKLGTVIVNIGNHEFDVMGPEEAVAIAEQHGIRVIGTVDTAASGRLTRPTTDVRVGPYRVRFVGVGTNQLNTYPQAYRDSLEIPDPVQWVRDNYERMAAGADYAVFASHAGLVADRAMIFRLTDNTVYAVGGHDHLTLRQTVAGVPYMHNGFRGEMFSVAEIYMNDLEARVRFRDVKTESIRGTDRQMAALVDRVREEYLEAEDRAIVGVVPMDMTVREAAFRSVEVVRDAVGADVAFLNHTSFGSGVSAGPLPKYRFDQFMRFDNDVMVATVDSDTLQTILDRSNQHLMDDLAKRTGDYLYASDITVRPGREYKIATSSWVALDFNQMGYLGTTVEFQKVPGVTTKGLITAALNR